MTYLKKIVLPSVREQIKKKHIIAYIYHRINKARLKNHDFTILSQNCWAGVVYHILGQEFKSPTINLRINTVRDFIVFLRNINHYLDCSLQFESPSSFTYPIGFLDDIMIHFNHYQTAEEANYKWEERKRRINFDNVYIFATDYVNDEESLSKEEILLFSKIPCRNLIVFTQEKHKDIPYCKYIGPKKMHSFLNTSPLTGLRRFEYYFDYVKWLNSTR